MTNIDGYLVRDVTLRELHSYKKQSKGSSTRYADLVLKNKVVHPKVTVNSFTGQVRKLTKLITKIEEAAK